MPVTEQQIAEWERLANAATPGPWKNARTIDGWPVGFHVSPQISEHYVEPADPEHFANMQLLDASRDAIPALLADLKEAKAELAAARQQLAAALEWRIASRKVWDAAIAEAVEPYKRDAERYQFVRAAMFDENLMLLISSHDEELETPNDLARVIDAAIASQEKP